MSAQPNSAKSVKGLIVRAISPADCTASTRRICLQNVAITWRTTEQAPTLRSQNGGARRSRCPRPSIGTQHAMLGAIERHCGDSAKGESTTPQMIKVSKHGAGDDVRDATVVAAASPITVGRGRRRRRRQMAW